MSKKNARQKVKSESNLSEEDRLQKERDSTRKTWTKLQREAKADAQLQDRIEKHAKAFDVHDFLKHIRPHPLIIGESSSTLELDQSCVDLSLIDDNSQQTSGRAWMTILTDTNTQEILKTSLHLGGQVIGDIILPEGESKDAN